MGKKYYPVSLDDSISNLMLIIITSVSDYCCANLISERTRVQDDKSIGRIYITFTFFHALCARFADSDPFAKFRRGKKNDERRNEL